jgi:PAS domain S-box-containing protein
MRDDLWPTGTPSGANETAAGQANDEFERFFQMSLHMLCIAGTDGYFRRVNPAFERTLGFSAEELLSMPFIDFVHPDDHVATLRELARLGYGAPSVNFENRYRCKDGSFRWLSWTSAPQEGGLLYVAAVDVTDRRRAQDLFQSLLQFAPDPVVIVDGEGIIRRVNALTEQLFGYDAEEMLGQPVEIIVPHRFRSSHMDHRAVYRHKPHVRPMGAGKELCAVRKDGTEIPVEISLGPVETDEGLLVMSTIRDISERKKVERRLREQEAELLAAERIQERLRPQSAPKVEGFQICGAARPAVYAAGDLYDYFHMPGGTTGIVVGDVTGHGFSSALLMASTHAYVRSLAASGCDVDEIMRRMNDIVVGETHDNLFVTMFFGRLDAPARRFVYTNAGHPTGYVIDASGRVKACMESTGMPLGILPDSRYPRSTAIDLETGDVVLLLTDGLIEAESPNGEHFGVERVLDHVGRNRSEKVCDIVRGLYDAVMGFAQRERLADDATLVVAKCVS